MLVGVPRAKEHLRISPEVTDDDALINGCVGTAIAMVISHIDRPVYASTDLIPRYGAPDFDRYAVAMGPAIEAAVLMLVDGLYHGTLSAGRDGSGTLPDPVAAVLAHLRVWRPEVDHGAA